MWLMDAIAMSDGTIGGVAKLLAESIPSMSPEDIPPQIREKTQKELVEYMVKVISDAYETSVVVRDYIDKENAKGRVMNDIYDEVKPFMEERAKKFREKMDEEDEFDDLLSKGKEAEQTEEQDPSFMSALMTVRRSCAPHRRLNVGPEDPRVVSSILEGERRGVATPLRPYPRASEIREPLMLIGPFNAWSEEQSRAELCFSLTGPRDPSFQESKLRLHIPEEGIRFQIWSAKQGRRWKLTPMGTFGELRDGDRTCVPVNIHHDKNLSMQARSASCFEIPGSGRTGVVDVWAAMGLATGVEVWFMDLA